MAKDFDIERTTKEHEEITGNCKRKRYPLIAGDVFEIAVRVNGVVQNTIKWTATARPDCTPAADVRVVVRDDVPEE